MCAVECVMDKTTKESPPAAWEVAFRIIRHAMERGLLVRPLGNTIVLSPPLVITRKQIDEVVDMLGKAIKAVADELIREGLWKPTN